MKLLQTLTLCGSVLLMASCDPSGNEEYVIANSSSKTIWVNRGSTTKVDTSYRIEPGQSLSYQKESGIGVGDVGEAPKDNKLYPAGLLGIYRDSTRCKKDEFTYSNWGVHKNKKYDYTVTFNVTDADF